MKKQAFSVYLAFYTAVAIGLTAPAVAQVSDNVIKIGVVNDLSSVYADVDGMGGVEAIRMAIADMGGSVNGKKIELVFADHQNKADIASSKAREWFDRQGLDVLLGGQNSATNLAMAKIAADKKKPFIAVGSSVTRLTNEECTPYTVHYVWDTVSLSKGPGSSIVKQGGKSWYFLAVDHVFGHDLEKATAEVVKASGGTVLGSVKHPLSASDFSSFMLQAQASKAQILALSNAGGDTVNAIKSANEFGINKNMRLVALVLLITDVHSLGLNLTQNMYLLEPWYWDQSPESRIWARRYFEKLKKMPTSMQAGHYSATTQYLRAVKAIGSDDGDKGMAQLKKTKINDMFTKNGYIRADGRMVYDQHLMQVKTPAESKYPWDYYKLVQIIPGEQAFTTKAETRCQLWK